MLGRRVSRVRRFASVPATISTTDAICTRICGSRECSSSTITKHNEGFARWTKSFSWIR
ncbi:hypothetical protein OESDEN_17619 [Oesophagostomum dentatum]|uniref:Uncharacterized protein n=1 Tax=Oesophagostomum dentatum TaxID=61180 RepID=A0A0B1SFP0_OESDE|nr:hypothetical protein OESDEN_17619 [Oesophagostomum dentatum]